MTSGSFYCFSSRRSRTAPGGARAPPWIPLYLAIPEKASIRDPGPIPPRASRDRDRPSRPGTRAPPGAAAGVERKVSGVEILMVIDVLASMNIEDLDNRSRLEVAKDTMRAFIQKRVSDRMGFVI